MILAPGTTHSVSEWTERPYLNHIRRQLLKKVKGKDGSNGRGKQQVVLIVFLALKGSLARSMWIYT